MEQIITQKTIAELIREIFVEGSLSSDQIEVITTSSQGNAILYHVKGTVNCYIPRVERELKEHGLRVTTIFADESYRLSIYVRKI